MGLLNTCTEDSDYERALRLKEELGKDCLDKFWGMRIDKRRPSFLVTTALHYILIVQDSTGFKVEEVEKIDDPIFFSDGRVITETQALVAAECAGHVLSKVIRGFVSGKERILEFYPTETLEVYYIPEVDSLSSKHYSNLQNHCYDLGDGWYYSVLDKPYDPDSGIRASIEIREPHLIRSLE